jgi:hypothetical protein
MPGPLVSPSEREISGPCVVEHALLGREPE